MKRFCLYLWALLALSLGAALAEGDCPLSCALCRSETDCFTCARCAVLFQTARPAAAAKPAPTATVKPAATVRPASAPQASTPNVPNSSPSTGDYTTLSATAQEQKMLNLLNQDRARNGLSALPLDSELSAIARAKSREMMEKGYFSHESPAWGKAASMLTAFGYAYDGVGENIAHHATVEKAEAAFLSSSAHRIVMMGSQWKKVGIGICIDQNGYVYVTELFVR